MGITHIDAGKLFGNFFDPADPSSGKEPRIWVWPEELGEGTISMYRIYPGLVFGVGQYRLFHEMAFDFGVQSPLTLAFSLEGNIRQIVLADTGPREIWHFQAGSCILSYLPVWGGETRPPVDRMLSGAVLQISPNFFRKIVGTDLDLLNPELIRILEGDRNRAFYHSVTLSSVAYRIVSDILQCPFGGELKRLYIQGKALELLSLSLASVTMGQPAGKMEKEEAGRIEMARDLLLANMEDPPTLCELARRVGTNKNKLNRGFRELFGNSAEAGSRLES